jgi:ABC-type amino acid transport substrate-binding protein
MIGSEISSETPPSSPRGALRVGVDESSAPPLCFGPPGTAEFRGFEPDLLGAIAGKLGLTLRCAVVGWSDALVQLQQGQLDMLCRAVTITPERRRLVDFSDPYLETELTLVVRRDSPIRDPGDLIGLSVGLRRATVAEEFVRKNCPAATVRTFEMHAEPYRALADRAVDAVVDHAQLATYFARAEVGLRVSGALEGTKLRCGMVLAPGNEPLRRSVNQALAQLQANGTLEGLRRRWFTEGEAV